MQKGGFRLALLFSPLLQLMSLRPGPKFVLSSRTRKPSSVALGSEVRLIMLNKPYDVLTQFTDQQGRATLKDYVPVNGVYAAGRLDRHSEGLLLLTNNGALQARIAEPRYQLAKTYWVQVEGQAGPDQLGKLRRGVQLNDGTTLPAQVDLIDPPQLWDRNPPVRYRASIPTSWLTITIKEGRNRQVRRMTAAVGLPTLRLVRIAIGPWTLAGLAPGCWRDVDHTLV